jgi:hypothetical protein
MDHGGGTWVVVGESASEASGTAVILTSTNLTNLTIRASGTSRSLRKVIYDGAKFIATGDRGVRLYSTDGITWSAESDLGTRTVTGLAQKGSTWFASHSLMWGTPLVTQLPTTPIPQILSCKNSPAFIVTGNSLCAGRRARR